MRSSQHHLHAPLGIPLTHHMRLFIRGSSHIEHHHHIRRSVSARSLERVVRLAQLVLLDLREHVLQQRLMLRVNVAVPLDRLRQTRHQTAQPASAEQIAGSLVGRRESEREAREREIPKEQVDDVQHVLADAAVA